MKTYYFTVSDYFYASFPTGICYISTYIYCGNQFSENGPLHMWFVSGYVNSTNDMLKLFLYKQSASPVKRYDLTIVATEQFSKI